MGADGQYFAKTRESKRDGRLISRTGREFMGRVVMQDRGFAMRSVQSSLSGYRLLVPGCRMAHSHGHNHGTFTAHSRHIHDNRRFLNF